MVLGSHRTQKTSALGKTLDRQSELLSLVVNTSVGSFIPLATKIRLAMKIILRPPTLKA